MYFVFVLKGGSGSLIQRLATNKVRCEKNKAAIKSAQEKLQEKVDDIDMNKIASFIGRVDELVWLDCDLFELLIIRKIKRM
jgi:hypothetical protein